MNLYDMFVYYVELSATTRRLSLSSLWQNAFQSTMALTLLQSGCSLLG